MWPGSPVRNLAPEEMVNGIIAVPSETANNINRDRCYNQPLTIEGMGTLPTLTIARYPRHATLDMACNEYVG